MKNKDIRIEDTIEQFTGICKGLGIKLTHQRIKVFNTLAVLENHPSAEDVYRRVKSKIPSISFDTVYRTLALFENHGVINRVQCLDERARYDSNTTHHHHLICIKCKKIQDFSWPALDEIKIPEETKEWGSIESNSVTLKGICRNCLENEKGK